MTVDPCRSHLKRGPVRAQTASFFIDIALLNRPDGNMKLARGTLDKRQVIVEPDELKH